LRGHACNRLGTVLERALLSVKPGQDDDFVATFAQAKTIIAAMPGFIRLTLSKCLERDSTYEQILSA